LAPVTIAKNAGSPLRAAIICDYAEEQWPSMSLAADMLLENLQRHHSRVVRPERIRPRFVRRLSRLGSASRFALNADRVLNRMFDYPRYIRRIREDFDLFHIIDHSYSQLVHELPPGRTAVTCHDLRTFRCLLQPEAERRSKTFHAMTRRILQGLQRAARVACVSHATASELLAHRLLGPERVVVIPNGVAPIFSPIAEPSAEDEAARLLGPRSRRAVELLNVGSTIPRKRIDTLLQVFAAVRGAFDGVRLIRAGGQLTADQRELAHSLGVWDSIIELPFLGSATLAAVYRHAAVLLCPTEAEGFGLPLLEALACGTSVLASDIAALREVGGNAVVYAPPGDVRQWTAAVLDLIREMRPPGRRWDARRRAGIERAQKFSWRENAARTLALYRELAA
jgi:glycosyltransferase involved in cell wall biosynthesis